jgi:ABC-type transport system involved in multi-copper enzyme maturation permease subunit
MRTALAVEWLKFRRSTIAWASTLLAGLATPLMAVGLVALARSDLLSGPSKDKFAMALVGTVGQANVALETQVLAVVMLIGGGILSAWIFGREFADGTVGSLVALPTSRRDIAVAKSLIVATWCVAVAVIATALTLAVSALVSPATMNADVARAAAVTLGAGVLTGLLGLPFGWVAIATRGYLAAFTSIVVATALSQMLASIGWGAWVPYVAPALWAGAGGSAGAATVGPAHLALAAAFALAGAATTVAAFGRFRLA